MASETPLPMPTPAVPKKPLTSFKLISYDIFGTLVDWETSIVRLLQPLVGRVSSDSPYYSNNSAKGDNGEEGGKRRAKLAGLFNDHEHALQAEQPSLLYNKLLTEVYLRIAREWGVEVTDEIKAEADRFGGSVGTWSAFPDTVEACQRLAKHYKLVPLSNVNRESFAKTCAGPLKGVDFWRIYTAQDIGSYKPDPANFEYLIRKVKEEGGVEKEEILHVAQSLFHDHRPAKKAGLSSVWINRKGAGMGAPGGIQEIHDKGEVGYGWRFATLGELADEVEREFQGQSA